ncbi:ash family protein [Salmonella enterica]|nr:ash family protein [Salmonella enterica]
MFNVVIVSPSVLSDIKPEISEKLLNGSERSRDFFIPDVFVIAFPGFVVVTQDTDVINNVGQPIFVIVIAGSYCRINFPYNQLSPCIAGEGNDFPHNCFGWHKLNIVFVYGVANDSNTGGVLSIKATLDHLHYWRYAYPALYKTSAGRGNPKQQVATPDAESVFFVVCHTSHSMAWCVLLIPVSIHIARMSTAHHAAHNGGMCGYRAGLAPSTDTRNHTSRRQRMVTLAGLPKGRPVPTCAGISTPVNVTAPIERGNSRGDSIHMQVEAAVMATVPTQSHPVSARHNHVNKPFFVFRFWSPHLLIRDIIATSEKQARSRLRRPSWTLDKRYPIPVTDAVYQVVSLMRYTDGRRRTCQHREMWTSREQAEEYAARVAFMTDYVTVTADVVEVFHV